MILSATSDTVERRLAAVGSHEANMNNNNNRGPSWMVMIWLACLLFISGNATAEEGGLTFFGWSDQHVKTNGDVSHLLAATDAMNELPGTSFPKAIGGNVETPAFVSSRYRTIMPKSAGPTIPERSLT